MGYLLPHIQRVHSIYVSCRINQSIDRSVDASCQVSVVGWFVGVVRSDQLIRGRRPVRRVTRRGRWSHWISRRRKAWRRGWSGACVVVAGRRRRSLRPRRLLLFLGRDAVLLALLAPLSARVERHFHHRQHADVTTLEMLRFRGPRSLEAKSFGLGLGLTLSGFDLDLGLMASGLGLIDIGLVASNIYSAYEIN